jgi:hypothetical protein
MDRDDLAVTLWSLTDPELFTAYAGAGRNPDDYETWLGDILSRSAME